MPTRSLPLPAREPLTTSRQPTLADPNFTWSCVTTSPGQPCVARPSFIKNKHFGGHSPSAARVDRGLSCRPRSVYWWSLVLDCLSIMLYLFSTFSLRGLGLPFSVDLFFFVKSYLNFGGCTVMNNVSKAVYLHITNNKPTTIAGCWSHFMTTIS